MPVYLDGITPAHFRASGACLNLTGDFRASRAKAIRIGLVNNMPDSALESTERQFLTLLNLAAGHAAVIVSLYALPDVFRTKAGRHHIDRYYSGVDNLLNAPLDGLIVTGAEPQAPDLTAEPYWRSITRVIEWAEHNTHSTIWSCLAAHAAVLHMDGIHRQRLHEKRFGIFKYSRATGHLLTERMSSTVRIPHSRWNDIPPNDLSDQGYHSLTLSDEGIDTFVKQRKSLFVFFQGHPEYEANTLLLEYRRDVGRYLRGERDSYPQAPEDYFDRETASAFAKLRDLGLSNRSEDVFADFPSLAATGTGFINSWQPAAICFYGNWLSYLSEQKEGRWRERARWNAASNTE